MKTSLLFVTQQFPYPLTDGGNIRTFKILEALATQFEVNLIATITPENAKGEGLAILKKMGILVECVPEVKSKHPIAMVRTVLRSLLRKTPLAIAYNYNSHLHKAVVKKIAGRSFSAIHLNHLDTIQYFEFSETSPFTTLDSHNLLFVYYTKSAAVEKNPLKKWLLQWESRRMQFYEMKQFASMHSVLVCSDLEKTRWSEIASVKNIRVIPNGVDCEYFHPPIAGYSENKPILVFTGAMGYNPNADAAQFFIQEVMPLLRVQIPKIQFLVVGRNPPDSLLSLGNQWTDVTVTGQVEDVREYVWKSKIFVVPIRKGAGTRLKVLEAFAMGIPTVATTIGSEGIDFIEGQELILADSPKLMAEAILKLFREPQLLSKLGQQSVHLAKEKYDWKVIGTKLLANYGQ